MFKLIFALVAISCIFLSVKASPLNETVVDAGCVATNYAQVASVVASCSRIVINGIQVPAGKSLILHLKDGAILTFAGHITFGKYHWRGPLVDIRGKKVTINGQAGHRLDGEGSFYWDGKGGQGSVKPLFFSILTTGNSLFENINVLNCPERCVAVESQDTTFNKWNIDVSAGNKIAPNGNPYATNTDGFDIEGKNIIVKNSVIKNQDDCIAISGGSNMRFMNLECHGSHGLSMAAGTRQGRVGNDVTNIYFQDCKMYDGMHAIHIKSLPKGGNGVISNINYKNIQMSGMTAYGIRISQDYEDWGHPNNNVIIKGLNLNNVHGTMGGQFSAAVHIECASGGCANFNWSGIKITGGKRPNTCNYRPNGFTC